MHDSDQKLFSQASELEDEEKEDQERGEPFWDERKKESPDEISLLNRPFFIKNSSKRQFGFFLLFLLGLAGVAAILMLPGKKGKGAIQQEEEFQTPSKRELNLPKPPPSIPEALVPEEKIDKNALALKDARIKSAIVIFQNNSPDKTPSSDPNDKGSPSDPNQRFQEQVVSQAFPASQAEALGSLDTKILQGKSIDAVLETAINSDLPGIVRGTVSYDIYGESERRVLLPRGSRLVGQYNSAIRKGQARVFIVWNRVIRPDGIEVALNSGGTDALGRSGLAGSVNNHFWQIFGTSALLSIIGGGAANVGVNPGDQNNSISAFRDELAGAFKDSASKVLDSYIDIPPTINVKQGARMKVLVARDLDFTEALRDKIQSSSPQVHWVSQL